MSKRFSTLLCTKLRYTSISSL